MSDLFSVTFEDRKFISNIGLLGDHVRCTGGSIEISSQAALVGNYGMKITPITTALTNYRGQAYLAKYVEPQTRLRQRFYFDPNTISCSDTTNIFIAQGGAYSRKIYRLCLYYSVSTGYYFYITCFRDDATSTSSSIFSITDIPHYVELYWKASSGPGLNDGFFTVWVDGTEQRTLTGIDNDTLWVSTPRLGVVEGIPTTYTVSGSFYFDEWKANNDGSIIGA